MKKHAVVIIGGGPAGLAAALAVHEKGIKDILILERDMRLGGILNQCIHNGFGLHTFKEELTGPEYAKRFIQKVKDAKIPYMLDTMVLEITPDREITVINPESGMMQFKAEAIILAMGCRERPRGALNIPGYRPAGVYTAGTAQRLVNMEGYMPGRKVVILGSGDIGLIMARRLTLEGADVQVVAEIMPFSGGLKRNVVQCLDDFDIPLKLNHTVIDVEGRQRVEGVTIAEVDADRRPIKGTEEHYACDTLLLSVGLIPENELSIQMGVELDYVTNGPIVNESLETNVEGVFACGNVLHVHDLVDYVSEEATMAGHKAAQFVLNKATRAKAKGVSIEHSQEIAYTVPRTINVERLEDLATIRFRLRNIYKGVYSRVYCNGTCIRSQKHRILAPGEMEQVILKKTELQAFEPIQSLWIKIEEE